MTDNPAESGAFAPRRVLCAILCYNEEDVIGRMLHRLMDQTLFSDPGIEKTLMVVPNGCKDDTAGVASRAMAEIEASNPDIHNTIFRVETIEEGGKANAWNEVVWRLMPEHTDAVIFFDADTKITSDDGLMKLLDGLRAEGTLVCSSMPVKDLAFEERLSLKEKLIASNSRVLDGKSANISGSLYAIRREALRDLRMPKGLPVEDGFIDAMVKTDGLRHPVRLSAVVRGEGVEHVYASERTFAAIARHQERLVLGSAINDHLIKMMEAMPAEQSRAETFARLDREEPGWISRLISDHRQRGLPLVPRHFLTKRWGRLKEGGLAERIALFPKVLAGFGLDAAAYLGARQRMKAPDRGVGHW